MNGSKETKSEIRARLDEIKNLLTESESIYSNHLDSFLTDRALKLQKELETADEDLFISILESHKAICEAKGMGEKEAYGQEPAAYYTMAICSEAGEMANTIVKSLRNGYSSGKILEAIKSELPDVIIYSFILAYVLDINLNELVREKVEIVIQRAKDGYYGGEIRRNKIYKCEIRGSHESQFGKYGSGRFNISLDGPEKILGEIKITTKNSGLIGNGSNIKAIVQCDFDLGYSDYYLYYGSIFIGNIEVIEIFS